MKTTSASLASKSMLLRSTALTLALTVSVLAAAPAFAEADDHPLPQSARPIAQIENPPPAPIYVAPVQVDPTPVVPQVQTQPARGRNNGGWPGGGRSSNDGQYYNGRFSNGRYAPAAPVQSRPQVTYRRAPMSWDNVNWGNDVR